jgi:hypothetical protein
MRKYGAMPAGPATGAEPGVAILDGGPLNGRQETVESDAVELAVVMTDGQKHRYERTDMTQPLPDGQPARVFTLAGRYYGPGYSAAAAGTALRVDSRRPRAWCSVRTFHFEGCWRNDTIRGVLPSAVAGHNSQTRGILEA